eukprot:gene29084-32295_t
MTLQPGQPHVSAPGMSLANRVAGHVMGGAAPPGPASSNFPQRPAVQASGARPPGWPGGAGPGHAGGGGGGTRHDADDVSKPDFADTDLLAGLYDAAAEKEALLGEIGRNNNAATVAVQEEYVLNEGPLMMKVLDVARKQGLRGATPTCFKYIALGVEIHLVGLLQSMAREIEGMVRDGPNIRQRLAAIARGDKSERERRHGLEQERLLKQAESRSRKINEEKKGRLTKQAESRSHKINEEKKERLFKLVELRFHKINEEKKEGLFKLVELRSRKINEEKKGWLLKEAESRSHKINEEKKGRLLKQAESQSHKVNEEKKAQIQQAKDLKNRQMQQAQIQQAKDLKNRQMQQAGARDVLGGAFAFKRKGGGMFGQKGGMFGKSKTKGKDAKEDGKKEEGGSTAKTSKTASATSATAPAIGTAPGTSAAPSATPAAGGASTAAAGQLLDTKGPAKKVDIALSDMASAMERDPLLCRHPLVYKLTAEMLTWVDQPIAKPPPLPPPKAHT